MPTYFVKAKVDQIVTKAVELTVEASSEEEAEAKARAALQTFPQGVEEEGVKECLTVNSHYWIPRDIEFVLIKRLKKKNA